MNLKYKILGLAAAAAMTLGVAGSASADDTSATLAENPTGTGCTAAASGGSVDFGTYTWNGTSYSAPGTTPTFDVVITNTLNPQNCSVTVSGSDLINGSYSIPGSAVSLDATPAGLVVTGLPAAAPGASLFTSVAPGSYPVDATLDTTLAGLDHLPVGVYAGTITFTATQVGP